MATWRPDPEVMVKARHVQAGGRFVNDYDTGVGNYWSGFTIVGDLGANVLERAEYQFDPNQ